MAKIKLVVFDMDGTLLHPRSCWAYIHEHFGTDNTEMLKLYIERKISDKGRVYYSFLSEENRTDFIQLYSPYRMVKAPRSHQYGYFDYDYAIT